MPCNRHIFASTVATSSIEVSATSQPLWCRWPALILQPPSPIVLKALEPLVATLPTGIAAIWHAIYVNCATNPRFLNILHSVSHFSNLICAKAAFEKGLIVPDWSLMHRHRCSTTFHPLRWPVRQICDQQMAAIWHKWKTKRVKFHAAGLVKI